MADLEKIRISLEAARQVGSSYPGSLTNLVTAGLLQQIPTDPKDKTNYAVVTLTGSSYILGAKMEDVLGSGNTSSFGTCNNIANNCNYKVVNP
jgi:hypothetical protein